MKRAKKKQNSRNTERRHAAFNGGAGGIHSEACTTGRGGNAGMEGLLEKIFKEVIYFEDDIVQMENGLAAEVDKLLAPYAGRYREKQIEQLRATIYEAIFTAEAKTFWIGVRYAQAVKAVVKRG